MGGFGGQQDSPFASDAERGDIVEGEYTVVKEGEVHQETIVISNKDKPNSDL